MNQRFISKLLKVDRALIIASLLALCAFLFRLIFIKIELLGYDESNAMANGRRAFATQLPFGVAGFDHSGVFLYEFFKLVYMGLGHGNMLLARLAVAATVGIIGIQIFLHSRSWLRDSKAALVAAATFLLLQIMPDVEVLQIRQEQLASIFLWEGALAFLAALTTSSWVWAFVSGFLYSVNFGFKFNFIILVLPVIVFFIIAWAQGRLPRKNLKWIAISFGLGWFVPLAFVFGRAAYQGTMRELFFSMIGFNRLYVQGRFFSVRQLMTHSVPVLSYLPDIVLNLIAVVSSALYQMFYFTLRYWRYTFVPIFAFASTAVLSQKIRSIRQSSDTAHLDYFAMGFVNLSVLINYFTAMTGLAPQLAYHILNFSFFSVLAGFCFLEICGWLKVRGKSSPIYRFMIVLMMLGPASAYSVILAYRTVVQGEDLASSFDTTRMNTLDHDVAEYIRAHSAPNDRIYVWGQRTQLYHMSARTPASRYVLNRYNVPPWSDPCQGSIASPPQGAVGFGNVVFKKSMGMLPCWDITFLRELEDEKPVLVLDASQYDEIWASEPENWRYYDITKWPGPLKRFFELHYQFVTRIGSVSVYQWVSK